MYLHAMCNNYLPYYHEWKDRKLFNTFIVIKLHDGSVGCGESIGIRSAGTGEK